MVSKPGFGKDEAELWEKSQRAQKPLRVCWTQSPGWNHRDEGLQGAPGQQSLSVLNSTPRDTHSGTQ